MKDEPQSSVDRRHFLTLMAAGLVPATTAQAGPRAEQIFDVGPASRYATNGIYDKFRNQGFFLVQQAGQLKALSAYCTHEGCKVTAEANRTFHCHCHGSRFSEDGKVTHGPAKKDLPTLRISSLRNGDLGVGVPRKS